MKKRCFFLKKEKSQSQGKSLLLNPALLQPIPYLSTWQLTILWNLLDGLRMALVWGTEEG